MLAGLLAINAHHFTAGVGRATMTTISMDVAATIARCLSARRPAPATMVIFGAGGDLTKRLIMPALYNLTRADKLPKEFAIIGVDHNDRDGILSHCKCQTSADPPTEATFHFRGKIKCFGH
jgi:glucose-6-phosphate dehydrogenase-like protein